MENGSKPINPIFNSYGIASTFSALDDLENHSIGLTKREHFAGLAMSAMISNPQIVRPKEDEKGFVEFTERAVRYADELLKQLEK